MSISFVKPCLARWVKGGSSARPGNVEHRTPFPGQRNQRPGAGGTQSRLTPATVPAQMVGTAVGFRLLHHPAGYLPAAGGERLSVPAHRFLRRLPAPGAVADGVSDAVVGGAARKTSVR